MMPKKEPFTIVGNGYVITISEPWIHESELRSLLSQKGVVWSKGVTQEAIRLSKEDWVSAIYTLTQLTKHMDLTQDLPPEVKAGIKKARAGADWAWDHLPEGTIK